MTELLHLSAGSLRLEVAPGVGGSLAAFWSETPGGRRIDWLRPATAQALAARDPLAMASFPLVPFCNRIRDGHAQFEGRTIAFPPNHPGQASPHPLHGVGWQRPWRVLTQAPGRLALGLEVLASAAWPWRFSARQRIALDAHALTLEIAARNEDSAAMPLGLGHHPYFPRPAGTRLRMAAAAMWRTDPQVMPVALETGEVVDRLRAGADVDGLVLDNNFVGWERAARIDWAAGAHGPARHLMLEAGAGLDYFVIYSPAGADHFCAEPVSQCTDWLNLAGRYGRGPLGGARLLPGQSLSLRFTLTPSWGG